MARASGNLAETDRDVCSSARLLKPLHPPAGDWPLRFLAHLTTDEHVAIERDDELT